MVNKTVLVTTASFGSRLNSFWVKQQSNTFNITFNRIDGTVESERIKAMHPRLRGKLPKMLSWELYPGYDYYIWIDSSFNITSPDCIDKIVKECQDVDACFFNHSQRNSVNSEYLFVESLIKDGNQYLIDRYQGENMKEQVNAYNADSKFVDDKLFECGIFIYSKDLVIDKNYNLMKEWFYHNCLYSVQDQLSLPYLISKFKPLYKTLPGNVYVNSFFI